MRLLLTSLAAVAAALPAGMLQWLLPALSAVDEQCVSAPKPPPAARSIRRELQLSPQLCVCVLSYKRLDLLNATLRSILQHLEQVETEVSYEVVWVDNGSDEAQRQALHRELRIEKALLLGTNYGMAYGFNSLFFRLCAAPYILTLEEDWEWQGASSGAGRTALRDAMTVLRHDPTLSGVFLRPDTLDQFLSHSAWKRAGGGEGGEGGGGGGVDVNGGGGGGASAPGAWRLAARSSVF